MKTNLSPSILAASGPSSQTSQRGFALIMVLAVLVLLTVLILSFFASVSTERHAAENFAGGVSTRELVDSSVNLVMAQIIEGTKSFDGTTRLGWASQPGAIRTFTDSGNAHRIFKLYSAAEMVQDIAGGFPPGSDLPSSGVNWFDASQKGIFTDLNSPVLVPDSTGPILQQGETFSARYPIVDPTAQGLVEGFVVDSSGLGYAGVNPPAPGYDPTAAVASGISNPAPMPVRWIYVLADGNFISPTSANGDGVVSFAGTPSPTAANPIVGRIAFWTDDETAKINVNTASEGVFWDRPWAATKNNSVFGEQFLAARIPAQNEFQRFPGHPAATSLSTVFGAVLPTVLGNAASFQEYYNLAPRVGTGGTEAGTRNAIGNAIISNQDRLYSSMDEFIFDPARNANQPSITTDFLEKTRFFLTAQSRAPDVNLWNLPRVSLWPLQKDSTQRNAKDRLLARAATIGDAAQTYFFTRDTTHNEGSPLASSRSPVRDWSASMERNHNLYRFLQRLATSPVPGFGGNFGDKYPDDYNQILTQMVDFGRSNLNITLAGIPPNYTFTNSGGGGTRGERQVVPLRPPSGTPGAGTKGFGRFNTVTEGALLFYGTGTSSSSIDRVNAVFLMNTFNPTPGPPVMGSNYRYRVTGLQNFKINNESLAFPGDAVTRLAGDNWANGRNGMHAFNGLFASLRGNNVNKWFARTGDPTRDYPFYGDTPAPVAATATEFEFSGGDIEIEIHADSGSLGPGTLIQTIRMRFLPATFPKPTSYVADLAALNSSNRMWAGNGRDIRWEGNLSSNNIFLSGDVIRSVQVNPQGPTGGDFRLLAGRGDVPLDFFAHHPDYFDKSRMVVHSLRVGPRSVWGGSNTNQLVPGLDLVNSDGQQANIPAAARGTAGAFQASGALGDWDNGAGINTDGAYINPADSGNVNMHATVGDNNQSAWDGMYWSEISSVYRPALISQRLGSYFVMGIFEQESGVSFSPNRQIASAVAFGSLPTGVINPRPWQTLLFNPHPNAGAQHPGFADPPDHLMLDWFHMPIVEPYAISEPLSTAGRINMNYQIVPFSHIQRSTGVRGVLKPVRLMAIPDSDSKTYKDPRVTTNFRHALNLSEANGTLRGFEDRFAAGDIFRSASEICTISLVPTGDGSANPSYSDMGTWWSTRRLTGDNARESPYNHIYPRLTTKSDTFTVHYKVQALKKAPTTPATQWVEGRDMVQGEVRGSTTIERYVDPADPALPDFATDASATLDSFYRWRVLSAKRFNP